MPQKFCELGIVWVILGNPVCEDLGSAAPGELIPLSAKRLSPLVNSLACKPAITKSVSFRRAGLDRHMIKIKAARRKLTAFSMYVAWLCDVLNAGLDAGGTGKSGAEGEAVV
jgi:hypothetical protein